MKLAFMLQFAVLWPQLGLVFFRVNSQGDLLPESNKARDRVDGHDFGGFWQAGVGTDDHFQ